MQRHLIPVWFFVGLLLAVYGVLIAASGIAELGQPAKTVLAELHAPVWWGALLAVVGGIYCVVFRPRG
ncbi:MAG: hypothetical protein JO307_07775 [Bryobacterales bacterium]|nr:hypothetical protein [Bryobacterales bacterium]MBV9402044.1 hypothetical protein [Bryobacterales bacterium]